MIIRLKKRRLFAVAAFFGAICLSVALWIGVTARNTDEKEYIRWAEMNVPLSALKDTMQLDISTFDKLYHISWTDSLSYLACKNGNSWSGYKKSQLDNMLEELGDIYTIDDLMRDNKYFSYYKETFEAMLGGFLSEYEKQFLADRFRDKDYVPRSYFSGATPENNYEPSEPYTLTFFENPYSRENFSEGYLTLHIKSGGADSARQIKLRTKPSTGQWFLWEQFLLSDIRKPAAADPWA